METRRPSDPQEQALDAGLLYITDEAPGYRRVRRGTGFSYVDSDGRRVTDAERARIEGLVIPPAWEGVWIAPAAEAHIQATGIDEAGRKQYIYHPLWVELRDEVKFDRSAQFGTHIGDLRKRIDTDLRRHGLPRERVVALAVAVLDQTLIRVGNRRYVAENGSYGLTTIRNEHAEVNGNRVHLEFDGKGGAELQIAFENRRLARLIGKCQELRGQTLFSYESDGAAHPVGSADVNDYLSRGTSNRFTAKDMRTWGATSVVAGELAKGPDSADNAEKRILEAIDVAADVLGNTRSVCRDSYVHPEITQAYRSGALNEAWRRSREGKWISRAESAVNKILEEPSSGD